MSDEPKAVAYTGNDDDEVTVATTTEFRSLWDQVASMMASQMTVGEVDALVNEIERLRALITAWADAEDSEGGYPVGTARHVTDACIALRKAVGR